MMSEMMGTTLTTSNIKSLITCLFHVSNAQRSYHCKHIHKILIKIDFVFSCVKGERRLYHVCTLYRDRLSYSSLSH